MYQPYCPFLTGNCMYNYHDMYRSEEDDDAVEALNPDTGEYNEEVQRQPDGPGLSGQGFPGPGHPGPGPGGAPGFPGHYPQNPSQILRLIEYNDPEILRTMTLYGIPLPTARNIIRRIIVTTLRFCR